MTSAPGRKPGARPSITARTSASADTQITTASTDGGEIGECCGRLAAELGGERERFVAAAIPDGCEQPGPMEIFRHGSTHGTETCKANALHRRELSGASATKENAVRRTAFIEY